MFWDDFIFIFTLIQVHWEVLRSWEWSIVIIIDPYRVSQEVLHIISFESISENLFINPV